MPRLKDTTRAIIRGRRPVSFENLTPGEPPGQDGGFLKRRLPGCHDLRSIVVGLRTLTQFSFGVLALASGIVTAQQVPDTTYRPTITHPSFAPGQGSTVLIDEGHYNFHTREGRYQPFALLLEDDGFRVGSHQGQYSKESLETADILVISNALHEKNRAGTNSWKHPVFSAFTSAEIRTVNDWVKSGGSLLLIADHMPLAGAASELAASFGFEIPDGYAFRGEVSSFRFNRDDGSLLRHAITDGTRESERVDLFLTFTGTAFQAPAAAEPLLVLVGSHEMLLPVKAWEFTEDTPRVNIEGWLQGAVMRYGEGRIAVFGEAAAFSAQRSGNNRMGMNSPGAPHNFRFVLNVCRWLAGILPDINSG